VQAVTIQNKRIHFYCRDTAIFFIPCKYTTFLRYYQNKYFLILNCWHDFYSWNHCWL